LAPNKSSKMAKYRGAHLDHLDQEEKELNQEISQMKQDQVDATPVSDPEEDTYRKRYGDLRRHNTHLMQQKDVEIEKLKNQLDSAAKGQIRFPKTDEEIDMWAKKYPDVAKIVDSIAQKRANEAMQGLREGEKRLEALETKISRKDAEHQLNRLHPDFNQIRQSQAFHEWVAMQPQNIQDALYKNNTDARAAARAIDLYKADTGKKTVNKRSAAQSVGRTNSSTPTTNGTTRFSESAVSQMNDRDYAKNEEAIMEAMRSGNFVYDMSGAAR